LIFGIPVYNEEGNVDELLTSISRAASLLGRDYLIVIVNDGSTDRTVELINGHDEAKAGHVLLLNQDKNMGVARAFDSLFKHIVSMDEPWDDGYLVTIEGDNTSDLGILGEMVRHIDEDGSDLVLASCYAPGGSVKNTDVLRVFLSMCANLFIKSLFCLYGVARLHTFSSFWCFRGHNLILQFSIFHLKSLIFPFLERYRPDVIFPLQSLIPIPISEDQRPLAVKNISPHFPFLVAIILISAF